MNAYEVRDFKYLFYRCYVSNSIQSCKSIKSFWWINHWPKEYMYQNSEEQLLGKILTSDPHASNIGVAKIRTNAMPNHFMFLFVFSISHICLNFEFLSGKCFKTSSYFYGDLSDTYDEIVFDRWQIMKQSFYFLLLNRTLKSSLISPAPFYAQFSRYRLCAQAVLTNWFLTSLYYDAAFSTPFCHVFSFQSPER